MIRNFKIYKINVPGVFEIPIAIRKNIKKFDAFLALGCVIKGQTPHFNLICNSTFDAILETFGLNESEVISLMRSNLKPSSFRLWRKRVSGRKTKHQAKRNFELGRFKCSRQRNINQNKISKRNGSKRYRNN